MMADALWRVYLPEWVVVYSSDASGKEALDECKQVFAERYEGRVKDKDVQVAESGIKLRLPNFQGEYKDREDAERLKRERGSAAVVAGQGSPDERALLDYGRKMLRAK